jgi:hypothetical protein
VLAVYRDALPADHPLQGVGGCASARAAGRGSGRGRRGQSRAGYELLVKRKDPQAVWLDMARQDLAPPTGRWAAADADRFQAELTASARAK